VTDKTDMLRSLQIERESEDDAQPAAPPQWMWLAGVGIGAAVLGALIAWVIKPAPPAPPPPTGVEASASGANVAAPAGSRVASGYVVARRMATVAAEVTGRVLEIRVEEGDSVRRGQILATLEPTLARADSSAAYANAAAAEAEWAEAQRALERTQTLAERGFASDAALTAAQARADTAEARYNSARSSANRASAQLDRYEIRAPFSGVVVNKAAQPGEIISPISAGGGFTRTGICTLVDMESLEIEVDVSESYISRVSQGQRVEAVLDAYPDVVFPAHVIATSPAADRSRATVRVRIGFDELDPRILPEMAIKVSIIDDQA
jgi:RND family efflux transporter MFP subunit